MVARATNRSLVRMLPTWSLMLPFRRRGRVGSRGARAASRDLAPYPPPPTRGHRRRRPLHGRNQEADLDRVDLVPAGERLWTSRQRRARSGNSLANRARPVPARGQAVEDATESALEGPRGEVERWLLASGASTRLSTWARDCSPPEPSCRAKPWRAQGSALLATLLERRHQFLILLGGGPRPARHDA
jgi:hypothetical protein